MLIELPSGEMLLVSIEDVVEAGLVKALFGTMCAATWYVQLKEARYEGQFIGEALDVLKLVAALSALYGCALFLTGEKPYILSESASEDFKALNAEDPSDWVVPAKSTATLETENGS